MTTIIKGPGSLGSRTFEYDFVLVYEAPYFKVLNRSGVAFKDTSSCWSVLDSALGSFPKRAAKVLAGRSYGVCPNDVFPMEDVVTLGESTVIDGLKGSLKSQDEAAGSPLSTLQYAPPTVFDFSGQACDGFRTQAASAYRCQFPWLRWFLALGSGRGNGKNGIHLQPSSGVANQTYAKVGDAVLVGLFVSAFETSLNLDTSDGTIVDDCAFQQCADCVLDGGSEPTIFNSDFWDFTGSVWKIANVSHCYHAFFGPNNQIEPGQVGAVGLDWNNVDMGVVAGNIGQQFTSLRTGVILRGSTKKISIVGNSWDVDSYGVQVVNADQVSDISVTGNTIYGEGSSLQYGIDLRTAHATANMVATGNVIDGGTFLADIAYDQGKQVYLSANRARSYSPDGAVAMWSAGVGIMRGTGAPGGFLAAPIGTLYLRTDGTAGATLYVKESNPGSTSGWAAK